MKDALRWLMVAFWLVVAAIAVGGLIFLADRAYRDMTEDQQRD